MGARPARQPDRGGSVTNRADRTPGPGKPHQEVLGLRVGAGLDGRLECADRRRPGRWLPLGGVDELESALTDGAVAGAGTAASAAVWLLALRIAAHRSEPLPAMDQRLDALLAACHHIPRWGVWLAGPLGRLRDCFDLHVTLLGSAEMAARLLLEARRHEQEQRQRAAALAGCLATALLGAQRVVLAGYGGGLDHPGGGCVPPGLVRAAPVAVLVASTSAPDPMQELSDLGLAPRRIDHAELAAALAAAGTRLLLPALGIDPQGIVVDPNAHGVAQAALATHTPVLIAAPSLTLGCPTTGSHLATKPDLLLVSDSGCWASNAWSLLRTADETLPPAV